MGKAQRDKWRRGEAAAKRLLADRGYTILADTSAGLSTDDLVVQSPEGRIVSVEVKNTKAISIQQFVRQARNNAGKHDWLLLCHIHNTSSWLVMGKNRLPVVWHEKVEL